ncbi:unnamed protein product [marine sediment metagenome]|uniref:Nuclease associated modular domain-containing protein n=1 Tax=marine sediment metagenome TaxID=412755 RepID=X0YR93_9ZZZZ
MPSGVYKHQRHTEETIKKMSKAKKGKWPYSNIRAGLLYK